MTPSLPRESSSLWLLTCGTFIGIGLSALLSWDGAIFVAIGFLIGTIWQMISEIRNERDGHA